MDQCHSIAKNLPSEKKMKEHQTSSSQHTSSNDESNGFTLKEIEGDLFTSSDSLCHCVSEDLRMGKVYILSMLSLLLLYCLHTRDNIDMIGYSQDIQY